MIRARSERAEVEATARVYRQLLRPGSEACPEDERLAALLLREIAGQERDALADHVTRCDRCSRAYRVLLDLHRAADSGGGIMTRVASHWRSFAVAAGLAALGVGLAQLWPLLAPSGLHSGESGDVVRGGSLPREESIYPPRDSILKEPPASLSWPACADAATYQVKLFDEAGRMIWQSEPVAASTVAIPALTQKLLADGHDYFWVVEVTSGSAAKRLGPFSFRLDSTALGGAAKGHRKARG